MKREVIWIWAAEADLQRLFAEAEDSSDGNGLRLLTEIEKATVLLLCFPLLAPN
jgi:hypothetical protein